MKEFRGKIVWLRPDQVLVDARTQRALRQPHAESLARTYSLELFGLGHVAKRSDGNYYVVDGQHRCEAARIAGAGHIPAPFMVHEVSSIEEEAKLFKDLNRLRKSVDKISLFHVRVTGKDQIALAIENILDRYSLAVPRSPTSANGYVSAVDALESVYKTGTLNDTISVLSQAWGGLHEAYHETMLRAVSAFLLKHGKRINQDRLALKLRRSGMPSITVGKIKTLREFTKQEVPAAGTQVLEGIYNCGAKTSRLTESAQ